MLLETCRCSWSSLGKPHGRSVHTPRCQLCPCPEYRRLETVDTLTLSGVSKWPTTSESSFQTAKNSDSHSPDEAVAGTYNSSTNLAKDLPLHPHLATIMHGS